jgi:hypothetical protein
MDLKTPGSEEMHRNLETNLQYLLPHDQIKFVICDRKDYEWAKSKIQVLDLGSKVSDVLFSPSKEELPAATLADWILEDRLAVRFMHEVGYDPAALIGVMEILAQAGGGGGPEFLSSHPNPDNRIGRIREELEKLGYAERR